MLKGKKIKIITKSFLTIIFVISFTSMSALNTYAHSGRTDSSGGHRDNKNASGLGGYHYHHGYGPHLHPNGVCPYTPKKEIPTPTKIAVNSVKISSNNTTTFIIGENRTLSAIVSPENAENKSISWSSNDTNIATVSSTGVLTAKNAGTTVITAKANNGKTDLISLTIDKTVEDISIAEKDLTLVVGENKTLSATIKPEDATNKAITWSSNDTNVATVSSTGVITAKNAGTTSITARAFNGKTSNITLSVNKKEEPVSISSTTKIEEKKPESQNVETAVGFGLIASLIAGIVKYIKK